MLKRPITEKYIEKTVCDYAKEKGWLVYKFVSPANNSVPDRIFFKNGVTMLIEFKRPGQKLTALQKSTADKIAAQGIYVFCCDNVADGKGIIDNFRA